MKNIFSTLLVATMLLLSIEAQATINDEASLRTAIENAVSASSATPTRIVLDDSVTLTTKPLVVCDKNIELDLNGYKIKTSTFPLTMYFIKGNLTITGKEGSGVECNYAGDVGGSDFGAPIRVLGSTSASAVNFTTLTIDRNVKLKGSIRGLSIDKAKDTDKSNLASNKWGNAAVAAYVASGFVGAQYGITINIDGSVHGEMHGVHLYGNLKEKPNPGCTEAELSPYPHINIYENAKISSTLAKVQVGTDKYQFGCAIYAAGWGIWLVKGQVSGCNGIYAKGGWFTVQDANIAGKGEYTSVLGNGVGGASGSGSTGGGNAVTLESTASYPGYTKMVIEGNTQLSSEKGYALEEVITKDVSTQIQGITIKSGTFVAPEGRSIKITTESKAAVSLEGGNFSDDEPLKYIGEQGIYTYTNNGDKDIVAVAQKPVATAWMNTLQGADESSYVDLDNTSSDQVVDHDLTIAYLRITAAKTLTVNSGSTLTVGEVVVGKDNNAKIIIKAGGKLKITGYKGLIVPSADQFLMEASATDGTAMFLLSPTTQANNTPLAALRYVSQSYMDDSGSKWELLACPFAKLTSFTSDWTNAEVTSGYDESVTIQYHDAVQGWLPYADMTTLYANAKPFGALAVSNPSVAGGVVYTLKGSLQGNAMGSLDLKQGWNYIGNGWTANLNTATFINAITADDKVDSAMYSWNFGRQGYDFGSAVPAQLPAVGFIAIYAKEDTELDLNYNDLIWNNNNSMNAVTRTTISITSNAHPSYYDYIEIAMDDAYPADFTFSSKKLHPDLHAGAVDVYAEASAQEDYCIVKKNDIDGVKLVFQANATDDHYTMSFSNVPKGCPLQVKKGADGEPFDMWHTYPFTCTHGTTCDFYLVNPKGYTRSVTNGNWGTICLPYASSQLEGATFYEVVGYDKTQGVALLQFADNQQMAAGTPYVFKATSNLVQVTYTGDYVADTVVVAKGFFGSFIGCPVADGNYILYNNALYQAASNCSIKANRAYFDLEKMDEYVPQPTAPGRKLIFIGGKGVATRQQTVEFAPMLPDGKMMVNGQLIIRKDGRVFNAQGQQQK